MTCKECHSESSRLDNFLDISLVLRPFGSDKVWRGMVWCDLVEAGRGGGGGEGGDRNDTRRYVAYRLCQQDDPTSR